jgi:UPF0755 protein
MSPTVKATNNQRRWPKMLLIAGIICLILIISSVLVIRRTYESNLRPVSSSDQTQQVVIPKGASVKEIARILKNAKLIKAAWAFEWYVRNNGALEALQAGTYPLSPNRSVEEIVSILTDGKVSTDLVTILPAKRLDQIKDTLINYGFDEASVDAAMDPKLYADHPALADKPAEASLEGYLYPETFQKNGNTTPEEVIRRSLDQMQLVLTDELRAKIAQQGLTVHQAIILASIVEQESGAAADRPTIAQIFLKRYRIGMQLGADVTSLYGAHFDGVPLPADPAKAAAVAIAYDSPYNTRKHAGLPPGPISNVSKSSLEAVANPSSTDYLFFVAGDPDENGNPGKTYFANTVAEHDANVAQHCKILCN